jgi:hypothetical protein
MLQTDSLESVGRNVYQQFGAVAGNELRLSIDRSVRSLISVTVYLRIPRVAFILQYPYPAEGKTLFAITPWLQLCLSRNQVLGIGNTIHVPP